MLIPVAKSKGQVLFYWRGIALVQYWRSFDELETFARKE
jgi:hypothetical protein